MDLPIKLEAFSLRVEVENRKPFVLSERKAFLIQS